MKIGIIAHLKHPIKAPFAGGLEVFTHQITKLLVDQGHQVILFASSSSDETLPVQSILSDDMYDGKSGKRIKRNDLPSEYIAEHHAYFSLMMTIDNYELDVVFNNSLHYIPITMANTINTPMLTVLHTPPFYELEMAIAAERNHPVSSYATVSQQSADNWRKLVPNCPVVENGININDWKPYTDVAEETYAVWFGRIHPDKGLHLAIEACQKAKIKLKVAGGIADSKYYNKMIHPILDDNTELLGLLTQSDLNRLIGGARVCMITPCWQEPFGLVVAEAIACGTPIAGFQMGALPELIDEFCGKLVPFPDVEALAEAIVTASKLDRNTVAKTASRFDIHNTVQEYEKMLEQISRKNSIKQAS